MKRKMKNIIKTIVFLTLVVCIGTRIFTVLGHKEMGYWQRYYADEQENVEVVVVGSSHAHCNVNQGLLWEEYGIAGYTLSCASQMLDSSYYYIKEAVETRNPKVIVLEVYGATWDDIVNGETSIYRNSLPMRWSSTFVEYINYFADDVEMDRVWKNQILTKIPIIHSRYNELVQKDFEDIVPFLKGYRGSYECVPFEEPEGAKTENVGQLAEANEEMLINIIEYTKEKNVELVLFKSPYIISEKAQERVNAVRVIAENYGVPFVDYNKLYDEIELDFATDLRDTDHLNNYGADKMTRHLGQFLVETCDIEDHRGQAGYESWDDNALYLRNKVLRHELEQTNDINAYLEKINSCKEDQTVILALTGNHTALGEVYLEKLMQLGITKEEYYTGGCWVFQNGEIVTRLVGKEYDELRKTPTGEIHLISTQEATEIGIRDNVQLMIHNENLRLIENGVNIIVYNEELGQVIDAAGDDIYLGLELIHNEKPDV